MLGGGDRGVGGGGGLMGGGLMGGGGGTASFIHCTTHLVNSTASRGGRRVYQPAWYVAQCMLIIRPFAL